MLQLSSKGTILGVTTRNPTDKELRTRPHVNCLSAYVWVPQNFCVPKSLRTAEDYISRKIGTVMIEGESPEFTNKDSARNSVYQINYISAMTSRMTGSVQVALIPSMNVSETNNTV